MKLTIVTVSTGKPEQPYYCYDAFFASCRRFGYEPVVLNGHYTGLGSKPRLLKMAIEDGLVPTAHMIFCDCFDVVMQREPAGVLGKAFYHEVHSIHWGAEKSCFPDASLAEQHPDSPTAYRYLNSGVGFGETKAFHEMLIAMDAENIPADHQESDGSWTCPNDQGLIMEQFLYGPVPMTLDHYCFLVQNLCSVTANELSFDEKLIRNKETGMSPVFLHFNGPSKTSGLREPILQHLGLA